MSLRQTARGFTLIELMVTVSLIGLLLAAAAPAFTTWIANAKVRATTESLQNGIRLAQTEAVRRNEMVVFALTDATPPSAMTTASRTGHNWAVFHVPQDGVTAAGFVQGSEVAAATSSVSATLTLPAGAATALCFGFSGRLVTASNPVGLAAVCNAANSVLEVTGTASDRRLQARVSLSGQVRMCDPARTFSSSTPDGC